MKVILLVGTLLLCLLQETHSGAIIPSEQSNLKNNENYIDHQPTVLNEQDQSFDEDINDADYKEALKLKSDIDFLLNEFMTYRKGTEPLMKSREGRGIITAIVVAIVTAAISGAVSGAVKAGVEGRK